MLIEVQEREQIPPAPVFVKELELVLPKKAPAMLEALGLASLVKKSSGKESVLFAGGIVINLRDLF
ncbi:MAG: hypothetical protein WCW52_09060 [Elusimicrobiales bacterium]|jgi:hypothetical protein